jgi:hypothetical protein
MANDQSQLTNMMMVNPWMFDPSQLSNQFSNYNNQAMPFPPTYNTAAGGPVSAATGQPIQSFQAWQQANPGGLNLNSTPAQPQAAPAPTIYGASNPPPGGSMYAGDPNNPGFTYAQEAASTPAARYSQFMGALPGQQFNGRGGVDSQAQNSNIAAMGQLAANQYYGSAGGQGAAAPAAPQASGGGAPNNWYAALNALSNPGTPAIGGATVPMQTGSQPAGGVNNAFLQQAQVRPGMNQNFMSALSAIQGRPQQGMT